MAMLDPARALRDMARQHLAAGRRGKAIACLYRGLALVPGRSDLHLELGDMLRLFGQAALSVARLRLAVALDPRNATALLNLALANRDRGDRTFALSGLNGTIELDPAMAVAWMERGNIHRLARRFPEAHGDLLRAVALDPSQPHAFALFGSCLHAMHLAARAESVYRRWVDLAPGNARAFRELASAMCHQGRVMESEPFWRRDLELTEFGVKRASPAWSGRRLLRDMMPTTRIGEVAKMLDIHVKTGKLGWRPEFRAVVAGKVDGCSNRTFLDYWKPHVDIVTDRAEVARIFGDVRRSEHPTRATRIGDGRVLQSDYARHAIQTAWEAAGYPPALTLKPEHTEHGRRFLAERGMPAEAWFVTFHIRENGFYRENYDNVRSCIAASYVPAMERIIAHGGWVCRIGDSTMTPLPALPNLIDATRLERRNEILDLFLIAAARFMVGSASGPTCIAVCFGTTNLLTNVFPMTERALGRADRFLPKIYRDVKTGNPMPFDLAIKGVNIGSDNLGVLRELGLEVIDNTTADIVEAVEEMLNLTANGNAEDNETRRLQDLYDDYCRTILPIFCSRIAGSFVRRHAALLDTAGVPDVFALPGESA